MGASPQTKAECDKKIADLNAQIARQKQNLLTCGNNNYTKDAIKNEIARLKTQIAELKAKKASLK